MNCSHMQRGRGLAAAHTLVRNLTNDPASSADAVLYDIEKQAIAAWGEETAGLCVAAEDAEGATLEEHEIFETLRNAGVIWPTVHGCCGHYAGVRFRRADRRLTHNWRRRSGQATPPRSTRASVRQLRRHPGPR
jgi:hypothetical protein